MELLYICGMSLDYHADYESNRYNYTTTAHTEKLSSPPDYSDYDNGTLEGDPDPTRSVSVYEVAVNSVIIPGVCIFGLLGNLLAFIVLGRRMREGVDSLEKGSLLSMIGKS